jgi:ribosomal protein L12E/L44/L45/RPP1/RPP2
MKGIKTMKSTLIRFFAIMTLASSMSGFALTEKAPVAKNTKSDNASCATASASYSPDAGMTDMDEAQGDNSQAKSRKQKQVEEQDNQWLHDLLGIYGG